MGYVDLSAVCDKAFSEMRELVLSGSKLKSFPRMEFGVRKSDLGKVDCPSEESIWDIGRYGREGKLFLAKNPGIIVDVLPSQYFGDNSLYVVLSDEGIYRFDKIEGNLDDYDQKKHFPELVSRKEEMIDYCVYGQKSLALLDYFNSFIEVRESEVKNGYLSQEGCLMENALRRDLSSDLSRLETPFNHHVPIDLYSLIPLDITNSVFVAS